MCLYVFLFFLLAQENCKNDEILLSLKYVRPGNGFEPKFQLLQKVDVNGKDAHPLFLFLREKLPNPSDDPSSLISDPKLIIWSPVCRNDVAWNFEKFLIGPDGVPFKRYSRKFLTSDIEGDIKRLLSQANWSPTWQLSPAPALHHCVTSVHHHLPRSHFPLPISTFGAHFSSA